MQCSRKLHTHVVTALSLVVVFGSTTAQQQQAGHHNCSGRCSLTLAARESCARNMCAVVVSQRRVTAAPELCLLSPVAKYFLGACAGL